RQRVDAPGGWLPVPADPCRRGGGIAWPPPPHRSSGIRGYRTHWPPEDTHSLAPRFATGLPQLPLHLHPRERATFASSLPTAGSGLPATDQSETEVVKYCVPSNG